jgi:hypothetical protein
VKKAFAAYLLLQELSKTCEDEERCVDFIKVSPGAKQKDVLQKNKKTERY